MKERRDGERGLSIMEALIIATITAMLALLIMPLLPRVSTGSTALAERGVDALDAMRGEHEFRLLLRAVSPREVDGAPQVVIEGTAAGAVIKPNLPTPASCAAAGAPLVRLAVEGASLVCVSEGRRRALLRWTDEQGTLSYSRDGVTWVRSWSDPAVAPLVRFELRRGARVTVSWVERLVGEAE